MREEGWGETRGDEAEGGEAERREEGDMSGSDEAPLGLGFGVQGGG